MRMDFDTILSAGGGKLRKTDLFTLVGAWSALSGSPAKVYQALQKYGVQISQASVYRSLKRLEALGGKFEEEEEET